MKAALKKIYGSLPLKKEVYSLLKKVYHPPKKVYQHLHFVGNFEVKVKENRSFKIRHYGYQIENEIFWNGVFNGWEKVSLRLWEKLCEDSETIMDIGANTGVYALIAKSIKPTSKVWAFEPVNRVFDKLTYNNSLNNYDIECLEEAVSDKDGTATIYDKDTEHTYSVTVNQDNSPNKSDSIPVTINTIRLDNFIEKNKIKNIDLIKMDVEMHEVEALSGMGIYLKKFAPTLLIEILNEEVANGISKLIHGINYLYFNIDENAGITQVDQLTKSDYFNFLICSPEVAKKLNLI